MAKELKDLTKRSVNYSQWYNELVVKADLAEQADVRGCMVIKPYGYAIWEKMQRILDDKFKETGLTPEPSAQVSAPSIAEADLVIECRKTYADWMKPDCFLRAENISSWYPNRDFHKIFFGEVAALSATEQYFL